MSDTDLGTHIANVDKVRVVIIFSNACSNGLENVILTDAGPSFAVLFVVAGPKTTRTDAVMLLLLLLGDAAERR
jgi:L-asparaginase/Glu-tRNA(Gln) amidotransferase subunit D